MAGYNLETFNTLWTLEYRYLEVKENYVGSQQIYGIAKCGGF